MRVCQVSINVCVCQVLTILRIIEKKVCTACSRTSYKIVPLTSLNKYLHYDTSETEVNINISVTNGNEKFYTKTLRLSVS